MQQWIRKQGMMGDDPPYLAVGTEVSAKYKGAFCEAKVRKVVRSVKCKVTFKLGLGTTNITDDQIRGTLRVGSVCEVKHPEKKEFVEATINKIQDCSQYTVVFDDGDITTLRRTALCLKSGRHFAESETLDQLPLTHPEHFGNPVIGGRKGRRSRQAQEESSDEEEAPKKGKKREEKEADIGKVVCVELGDKKKQKDNWFPGLVVAPTAQDTVRIRVRDEYLVRSFKDGRYFTVPKKEATEFTREIGAKVDNNTLRTAVDKALLFLDRDELPPHWDRDLLFGMVDSSGHSDSEGGLDSDSSDDEPREEKDHFVAQLYKFMDDRGTPINKGPTIGNRDVDLYKLFKVVHKLGGYNRVTNHNQWKTISHKLGFGQGSSSITNLVKQAYKKFLHSFEDFYRKLGCTMVNHPRGNRSRHRSGRSLIRDRDRATPVNTLKDKDKATPSTSEKANENSEKDDSQSEKKEIEKMVDEKDKVEDVPKPKEPRREKGKVKEEKSEVSTKEDKKSEKLKTKEEPETTARKDEKTKLNESVKEEVVERDDRLRTREGATPARESRPRDKKDDGVGTTKDRETKAKEKKEEASLRESKLREKKEEAMLEKGKDSKLKDKKEELTPAKDLKPKDRKEVTPARDCKPKDRKEEVILAKDSKSKDKKEETTPAKDSKSKDKKEDATPVKDNKSKDKKEDATPVKDSKSKDKKEDATPAKDSKSKDKKEEATPAKDSKSKDKKEEPTTAKDTKSKDKKEEPTAAKDSKPKDKKEEIALAKDVIHKDKKEELTSVKETKSKDRKEEVTPAKDGKLKERKEEATLSKDSKTKDKKDETTPVRDIKLKDKKEDTSPASESRVKGKPRKEERAKGAKADEKEKLKDEKPILTEDKSEELKKKMEKKPEEEEKQTRSKSKEDLRNRKEATVSPSQVPPREGERRLAPRPRREEDVALAKKRGRKRKDTDDKSRPEETLGQLASNISVGVGDKLKVYYGPTHESKVTYEAKVLNIEEDGSERMFLVHYTGWNTRYDEWIRRGRIADNLSWTPTRAKRLRRQQQLKASKPIQGKRGRPSLSGRSQEGSQPPPPRSTTPSSVTSSSSRTKSPATRSGTRQARLAGEGLEFRRRTRRMSGHTDISVASETESEEFESEPELEPTLTRSRSEKRVLPVEKEEPVKEESPKEDVKKSERPFRRKPGRKKELSESAATPVPLGEEDQEEKVAAEDSGDPGTLSDSPGPEKRRSRRNRRVTPIVEARPEVVKSEPESEEEQPKGRDFDLNQIRSELKGIEKAVKLPQDDSQLALDEDTDIAEPEPDTEEKECSPEKSVEEKTPEKLPDTSTEDIYEFKEPEPFEFEVRTKREPLSEERVGKLPRRPIGRVFDVIEPKVEKSPRKKLIRTTPTKVDSRDGTPFEGEVKKRFRRTIGRKIELVPELNKVVPNPPDNEPVCIASLVPVSEPVTPPKSRPLSACEEAFDKLCESPSFRLASKPGRAPSPPPTLVPELGPLSLFGEAHDDGEDDGEDRLVISETDDMETESEEPLFSYPQRDHEELFPTLGSSSEPPPPTEPEQCPPDEPTDPSCLLPEEPGIFGGFTTGISSMKDGEREVPTKVETSEEVCVQLSAEVQADEDVMKLLLKEGEDDEFEDDPINAAIQRVIAQSMMDDDTNDMDIFGGKQTLCSSSSSSSHFQQETKCKPQSPVSVNMKKDVAISDSGKRKVSKKPVLSKEFVEDSDMSDSDGSDEEQRLVIDKAEDEASCTSSQSSLKLRVSESSEMDMKLQLSEEEECQDQWRLKLHMHETSGIDMKLQVNEAVGQEQVCAITYPNTSQASPKLHIAESSKIDIKLQLSEGEDQEQETEVEAVEPVPFEPEPAPADDTGQEDKEKEEEPEEEQVQDEEQSEEEDVAKKRRLESVSESQALAQPEAVPSEVQTNIQVIPKDVIIQLEPEVEPEAGPDPVPEATDSSPAPEPQEETPEEPAESESNLLGSLLCQETIPGSPAQATDACPEEPAGKVLVLEMPFASVPDYNPALPQAESSPPAPLSPPVQAQAPSPGVSKHNDNEAAPVMDNTPPTTPDSSLSTISGSPREERGDMSPALDDSSKSHRDSFEIDLDSCAEGTKVDHYSEDDSLLNIDVSNSCDGRLMAKKPCLELDKESDASPKKRRRSRKRSDCESNKRLRHSTGRVSRNIGGGGSDSDDTSENSTVGCTPLTSSENTLSSRSPRPSKYNFYVELAPELDGSQRIALLQQKLQELRKTYMNVKAELACIDRRRKKLRRREREVEKTTKQEVACS